MVVNGRPLKRMKRRVTADVSDFLTFPSAGDGRARGPFRASVREFLTKHATLPPPSSLFPQLLTWQILFRVGDLSAEGGPDASPAVVCLDVVEEDVSRSVSVYCDQCRVVGWSGNPVCTKRYHFIIKADGGSIGGYHKSCAGCGDVLHLSESRCKSCGHVMTTEDVEDWMYHQLEDTSHLLHGVVHSNGFGHLLRVNGREGGSRVLSGCHIMDFWDRLCKQLGVRKVSVMDVSKKYGLEYRLLHAITKGRSWYGDWGYEFGSGSFALTSDSYKAAVETLSKQPLSIFLSQGRKPRTRQQDVISFYQSLSERELVNIRDLFCFLISLIHDAHKGSSRGDVTCKKRRFCTSSALCTWTTSDVERVEEAMFRVLRAVTGPNWVTWRTLKGAVCKVAPPELLDYCLKELKQKQTADGMVVHTRCNPDSGAIEYRLEPGSLLVDGTTTTGTNSAVANYPSEEHLLRDLRYLYESLLHPLGMVKNGLQANRDVAISSATTLLDCKQFVKDYSPENMFRDESPSPMLLSCDVELMEISEGQAPNPPPELLVLSPNATLGDLKLEASKAFQEVYLVFKRFQAEELVGYGGVDESTQVALLLGSTKSILVRGRCLGKSGLSRFRMERGVERWTVDCSCGAKDDDGERMLSCDACGVWRHTRCAGIPDVDVAPARFVCHRCSCLDQGTDNSGLDDEEDDESVGSGFGIGGNGGFGKSMAITTV